MNREKLALATFVALSRVEQKISSDIHAPLVQSGLTISQFGVLEALFHLGPLPQKVLCEKVLRTPGNLTQVIDALEKDTLVKRNPNPEDRRSFLVSLTELGRRRIAGLFPSHAERVEASFSSLTKDELQSLLKLLRKMRNPR